MVFFPLGTITNLASCHYYFERARASKTTWFPFCACAEKVKLTPFFDEGARILGELR